MRQIDKVCRDRADGPGESLARAARFAERFAMGTLHVKNVPDSDINLPDSRLASRVLPPTSFRSHSEPWPSGAFTQWRLNFADAVV
jgi:hypothetical protein